MIEQKLKQLQTDQVIMWRKIKQTSADAQFWRERALAAKSAGWCPRGPWCLNPLPPMQPRQSPIPSQLPLGQFGRPRRTGCNPNAAPFFLSECGNCRGCRDVYMQNATADSTDRVKPTTETQVRTNACMIKAKGPHGVSGSSVSDAQPQNNGGVRLSYGC